MKNNHNLGRVTGVCLYSTRETIKLSIVRQRGSVTNDMIQFTDSIPPAH